MGARQPIPRESTKDTVKPSRREGRNAPVVPVVPAPCTFSRTGAMGVASTRSSLRPLQLSEGHVRCSTRASCAARLLSHVPSCLRCESGFPTVSSRRPGTSAQVFCRSGFDSLRSQVLRYGGNQLLVMPGLRPGHQRRTQDAGRRGWPGRSPAMTGIELGANRELRTRREIRCCPKAIGRLVHGGQRGMTASVVPRVMPTYDDNRMSSRRRPSLRSSFFTALEATTSPSLA